MCLCMCERERREGFWLKHSIILFNRKKIGQINNTNNSNTKSNYPVPYSSGGLPIAMPSILDNNFSVPHSAANTSLTSRRTFQATAWWASPYWWMMELIFLGKPVPKPSNHVRISETYLSHVSGGITPGRTATPRSSNSARTRKILNEKGKDIKMIVLLMVQR